MKKIILLSIIFISISNANSQILEKYMYITENEMSSSLDREMESVAKECVNGNNLSCINLGLGSFANSAWRAKDFLEYFTPSHVVKKKFKKEFLKKAKKTYRKSKRITKSQIIRRVTNSSDVKNLNKIGIYKIIFKNRIGRLNKRGLTKISEAYIGKAVRQTVEQRLKNRSLKWIQSIKSIKVKHFPKEEIDKIERSIIGGATRFENARISKERTNYRNDKFHRGKHPNGKYFFEKDKKINGHQVRIIFKNSKQVYIKVDGTKVNMIRNGHFRQMARILSLLPKNLRHSQVMKKEIISAKIKWRNQTR
jgi:hypothetical protein